MAEPDDARICEEIVDLSAKLLRTARRGDWIGGHMTAWRAKNERWDRERGEEWVRAFKEKCSRDPRPEYDLIDVPRRADPRIDWADPDARKAVSYEWLSVNLDYFRRSVRGLASLVNDLLRARLGTRRFNRMGEGEVAERLAALGVADSAEVARITVIER
jgi:hypothetical protein